MTNQLPPFGSTQNNEKLKELIEHTKTIMPHQLAAATGCGLNACLDYLWMLAHQNLATPSHLVYHQHTDHADFPILSYPYTTQLTYPFTCEECEQSITSPDEITTGIMFVITPKEPQGTL